MWPGSVLVNEMSPVLKPSIGLSYWSNAVSVAVDGDVPSAVIESGVTPTVTLSTGPGSLVRGKVVLGLLPPVTDAVASQLPAVVLAVTAPVVAIPLTLVVGVAAVMSPLGPVPGAAKVTVVPEMSLP